MPTRRERRQRPGGPRKHSPGFSLGWPKKHFQPCKGGRNPCPDQSSISRLSKNNAVSGFHCPYLRPYRAITLGGEATRANGRRDAYAHVGVLLIRAVHRHNIYQRATNGSNPGAWGSVTKGRTDRKRRGFRRNGQITPADLVALRPASLS
jgi:hypothetical protein